MDAASTSRTPRFIETGFEVCPHECNGEHCISSRSKTHLWAKEGSSLKRHMGSKKPHERCSSTCRANTFLENGTGLEELKPYMSVTEEDVREEYTNNRKLPEYLKVKMGVFLSSGRVCRWREYYNL